MLLNVRKSQLDVAVSLSQEFAQDTILEHQIEQLRESGLLALVIPKKYGGLGATWVEALKIVEQLSQAGGLIGQIYGKHLILTALSHVYGTPEQKERYYRETAQNKWFWGDAINLGDKRLKISRDGENFRLNGVKNLGTNIAALDLRVFSAWQEGEKEPFLCIIGQDRPGIISNNNGTHIEQSLTNSGSFTFHNVLVKQDEILRFPNSPSKAIATLLDIIAQLTKTYVYLGMAKGAFAVACEYVKSASEASNTTPEPYYMLHYYGDLWIELQQAVLLAEQATVSVQALWEKEFKLTHEEGGKVAKAVFSSKALATRIGLDLTQRMFDLMGTDIISKKYNFDLVWQDLQTCGGVAIPWQGVLQNWTITNFPPIQTPC